MKHRIITAVIIAAIAACLLCSAASAMTGSGTQSNPYIISSQTDLALLSGSNYASYTGNDKYFELGADITMSGTFTPIGTTQYRFIGHFDGKNHKISGMKIETGKSGLFASITSGADIKNINLYDVQISSSVAAGALFGDCYGASSWATIENVNVYNSIIKTSASAVGGIGGNSGESSSKIKITSCYVKGCIIQSTGGYSAGGIIGRSCYRGEDSTISLCNVEDCIITAVRYGQTGGIAGNGAATATDKVDVSSCNVKNCYIFGNSPSSDNNGQSGGIVGCIEGAGSKSSTITDCTVEKCTIRSTIKLSGGIIGSYGSQQVMITNCDVIDCTIIAPSSGAAGIST